MATIIRAAAWGWWPGHRSGEIFIKRRIKELLLNLPGFEGLCRRLTRSHVRVLMFHRFAPAGNDDPRRLPADVFERQLAFLAAHHELWDPDRHLDTLKAPHAPRGRPPVVATIDDGYRDCFEVAFPLLGKYSVPAMVFVTTGFVAGRTWFWWDRLHHLLAIAPTGPRSFTVPGLTLQGDPGVPDDLARLWNDLADRLSVIDDDDKEKALDDLARDLGLDLPAAPPADFAAMTWDEVRTMEAAGIQFGAHTLTHPVLSRVGTDRARREIEESAVELAGELGKPVDWFCYPQGAPGDYTPETVTLVAAAGYRGCYVAHPDPGHEGAAHTLPRYSVSRDMTSFRWILCGAQHLFSRRSGTATNLQPTAEPHE